MPLSSDILIRSENRLAPNSLSMLTFFGFPLAGSKFENIFGAITFRKCADVAPVRIRNSEVICGQALRCHLADGLRTYQQLAAGALHPAHDLQACGFGAQGNVHGPGFPETDVL